MKNVAVIHYDEIALKGANRHIFEQKLVQNLAWHIQDNELPYFLEHRWGRIIATTHSIAEGKASQKKLEFVLSRVPGVSVYGIGVAVDRNIEALKNGMQYVIEQTDGDFKTFRISTKRVDKTYPGTSTQIDVELGAHAERIVGAKARVQLIHPDVDVRVEILHDRAYIYIKKQGPSGLPVGSSGKAVALLSGGFDSPVAVYMCAVRGVQPLLMHFHAYPQTSRAAIEKVEALARELRNTIGPTQLALVPLLESQKQIALTAPEKLRVILYRRLMMRIAQQWGKEHKAKAIITGESVGQVASQTLENMHAIGTVASMPILRPLCGMNKRDIIKKAVNIGTHDISVLPYDDTCTVFMPKNPETKARVQDVEKAEELYNVNKLVEDMLSQIESREI